MMVNAWNVAEVDTMALPPCHYGFQVYTREIEWYNDLDKIKKIYVNWSLSKGTVGYAGDLKADTVESANQIFNDGWQNRKDPFTGKPLIELECFSSIPKRAISLMWNQRSVDTPLGLPFNIASYGLLLQIIATITNMVPDELIGNLGDVHIYKNQQEGVKEQISRLHTAHSLPQLRINTEFWPTVSGECGVGPLSENIDHLINSMNIDDFQIEGYVSEPTIKMPLSN
jgi:thymidylate synthase